MSISIIYKCKKFNLKLINMHLGFTRVLDERGIKWSFDLVVLDSSYITVHINDNLNLKLGFDDYDIYTMPKSSYLLFGEHKEMYHTYNRKNSNIICDKIQEIINNFKQ